MVPSDMYILTILLDLITNAILYPSLVDHRVVLSYLRIHDDVDK
jgi:hypothetical protein